MAGQILVAMKRQERIEEIIPYIEQIAKPGMRVVFLLPYRLYLRDYWITTESPREAMLAGRKIMERYSFELQRGLAEQRVSPAREALQENGVEVAVEVYTGSLRRVVEDFAAKRDVHLIIMPVGMGVRIMRFLRRTIPFLGLFKRPAFPPVLLLHRDHTSL